MNKHRIALAKIPEVVKHTDIKLLFGQFLDDFRHADTAQKAQLIAKEPCWDGVEADAHWFYVFAAAAHRLANQAGIKVPAWCMENKYISPEPYYAGTTNQDYQVYLRENSLPEYVCRNLFLGDNCLDRV